ncbi:hypothetical protein C8Q70DRAFT_962966 [Cubamyces menziesii]|nr:hypothetical protein C8Q70DRAFT_962966 [Cubamyces menziesii]
MHAHHDLNGKHGIPSTMAGYVLALALPHGTFNVAHAPQVSQYAGDPVGMLKAIRRVAKACRDRRHAPDGLG